MSCTHLAITNTYRYMVIDDIRWLSHRQRSGQGMDAFAVFIVDQDWFNRNENDMMVNSTYPCEQAMVECSGSVGGHVVVVCPAQFFGT